MFECARLVSSVLSRFPLDTIDAPEDLLAVDPSSVYATHGLQPMKFDAPRKLLCWVARTAYMYNGQPYGADQYCHYEMDVQNKQVVRKYLGVNYGSPVYGLISPVWEGLDVSWSEPTYEVEGVYFEKDEIEVFAGYTA